MARGTLRIYLGAAPGVGQDLRDAQRGRRGARAAAPTSSSGSSRPTVGRTPQAQIGDLEVVPRHADRLPRRRRSRRWTSTRSSPASRRSRWSTSSRTPTCPGSRNEKRWQDVDELLDAGIDVISTVNVQHLESMNDVVEQITGIKQRETIPDAVVRAADQIELVDMTPEALRRRMAHGNIYPAEKVDASLANYFRAGQPRRAARARADVGRRPGRRGARGVPRGARHRPARGRRGSGSWSRSPARPAATT